MRNKSLNYKTVLCYCMKFRKNTKSKNPEIVKAKNGRIMALSRCAVCKYKKSKFIEEQEATGLLSSLKITTSLRQIPSLGPFLF